MLAARASRAWLLAPITRQLEELRADMALDLETLKASVTRTGQYAATVATLIPDLRGKIAALTDKLAQADSVDEATRAELAAITASVDATADALAAATAEPVGDGDVPTGGVEAPPETNPGTPDPGSVDGAVPAGEPLPENLDPNHQTEVSPGPDAAQDAAADAEASAPEVLGG